MYVLIAHDFAASVIITDYVIQKSLTAAYQWMPYDIAIYNLTCIALVVLAEDAIRAALKDYKLKQDEKSATV